MERVAFLCDGTACAGKANHIGCHECSHTFDVEHAIHFEKNGDFFAERDSKDILEKQRVRISREKGTGRADH